MAKEETEPQRRKHAFENAHAMDLVDEPLGSNINPPPTPTPATSPNAFKQLETVHANFVPAPKPPPPSIPEPIPEIESDPEPDVPESKAPSPPPPSVRNPAVPFATYPPAAPLQPIPPWKAPKAEPAGSTPFTGPPNLIDMAVDRAEEVEVVGSESADDRINRQQREAEEAGQVVDFSGDGGAADMDVAEQEQMRKRMLADAVNRSVPAAADEAMQKRRRQDALALGAAEQNRDNTQVQYEEMRGSGGGGTLSDLAAFKAGVGEIGEMQPTLDVKRELLVPNAAPATPAEPSLTETAAQYTQEDFNQQFIDQGSTKDVDRLARIAESYGSVADYEGKWDNSMGFTDGAMEEDPDL